MALCRHALDALEDGAAGTFGIDARADQSHGIQNLKEKVSETLRVFQQTGVLHEREYDERVSPSVHGAPRNAEVQTLPLKNLRLSPISLTIPAPSHTTVC